MSRFSQWAQKEHRLANRIAATILAGVIFVFLIPFFIIRLGPVIDRLLHLQSIKFGVANYLIGGMLAITGLFFAIWSIVAQLTRGRGTPLPMMATQELLIMGPFGYCRNPMSLGTILFYLGFGEVTGSIAGIGIVIALSAILILYLKRVEENELAQRFGEAYLAYKRRVPFLIPRITKPKRE